MKKYDWKKEYNPIRRTAKRILSGDPLKDGRPFSDLIELDEHSRKCLEFEATLTDQQIEMLDCQHFFRQIFLGYFSDIVQAFDTLRKNVCGDDYTSLHNPIVLSSVLPAYGMFHSIQILFL